MIDEGKKQSSRAGEAVLNWKDYLNGNHQKMHFEKCGAAPSQFLPSLMISDRNEV
jgi:hypothetical protein